MVTRDDAGVLERFSRSRGIGYPLLSDAGAGIIRAFGAASGRYPEGSAFHGTARSLVLVVDAGGVVRHRFSRPYPGPDAVLEAVRGPGGS